MSNTKQQGEEIEQWYKSWCDQHGLNGGVLIGPTIRELLRAFNSAALQSLKEENERLKAERVRIRGEVASSFHETIANQEMNLAAALVRIAELEQGMREAGEKVQEQITGIAEHLQEGGKSTESIKHNLELYNNILAILCPGVHPNSLTPKEEGKE